jgi:viroplasmin and RNaseH domain-containing protein
VDALTTALLDICNQGKNGNLNEATYQRILDEFTTTYPFWAVAIGRKPGIYEDYNAAKEQIRGVRNGLVKGFASRAEASAWMDANRGKAEIAFYVVAIGKRPGTYNTYKEANDACKGHPDGKQQKCYTDEEAKIFQAKALAEYDEIVKNREAAKAAKQVRHRELQQAQQARTAVNRMHTDCMDTDDNSTASDDNYYGAPDGVPPLPKTMI